jgi:hypothetical protein
MVEVLTSSIPCEGMTRLAKPDRGSSYNKEVAAFARVARFSERGAEAAPAT